MYRFTTPSAVCAFAVVARQIPSMHLLLESASEKTLLNTSVPLMFIEIMTPCERFPRTDLVVLDQHNWTRIVCQDLMPATSVDKS